MYGRATWTGATGRQVWLAGEPDLC